LQLSAGLAYVEAPARFVLHAPSARVEVSAEGGAFDLSVDEKGSRVGVGKGSLRLGGVKLAALEESFVAAGAEPATPAAILPSQLWRGRAGEAAGRTREGLAAFYTFCRARQAPTGILQDLSGGGLDLRIEDPSAVTWLPEGGLLIRKPMNLRSTGTAEQVASAWRSSDALTLEAWIEPAPPPASSLQYVQDLGPAHSGHGHLFTLMQHVDGAGKAILIFSLSQERLGPHGHGAALRPALQTQLPVFAGLRQLAFTWKAGGEARYYLDGKECVREPAGGSLSALSDLRLALACESTGGRHWLGTFHLVALYQRALGPQEVEQNFRAGLPGGAERAAGAAKGAGPGQRPASHHGAH
jgi:hypothetical protein